jgi:hypothetical protein
VSDRISDLAKKTNRYRVCDCGLGVFEVSDGRCLLDALLQWQAVLPFSEETGLSDFEELCEQQSEGPTLNEADQDVLLWLMENAGAHEDEDDARYYGSLCQASTVFEGSEAEVRRWLLAKLYLHL